MLHLVIAAAAESRVWCAVISRMLIATVHIAPNTAFSGCWNENVKRATVYLSLDKLLTLEM